METVDGSEFVDALELDVILGRVREALSGIAGVVALALGGSQALGTASEDSDIDIGIYYDPARPPEFDQLYKAAVMLDDCGRPDSFGRYGQWGPWINGGGVAADVAPTGELPASGHPQSGPGGV